MRQHLLPAVERAARFALHRRGFTSRTIPTDVAKLHAYETRGNGELPTTVVLHGIGSAATSFGMMLDHLRPHVQRLIAPDLPGHGFSAPPNVRLTPDALFGSIRTMLDTVAEEPMVLIGNSLGGAIALRYAIENPHRVRALALVSPAGARLSDEEWGGLVDSFRIESEAAARRVLERIYHRMPWYMPVLSAGFRDVMQRRAIRDILDTATIEDAVPPEKMRGLSMPILLVWGQSERILPPSALEYFRRHLPPHTRVEEPSGFGHCPHVDDPERLTARIVDFARASLNA